MRFEFKINKPGKINGPKYDFNLRELIVYTVHVYTYYFYIYIQYTQYIPYTIMVPIV